MKLKSNKGSSMLLVIVFIAILLTLCGAMISVINTNYRAKSKEANRIKNLYEAEAGLDVAYNILVKSFEAGVTAGNVNVNKIEVGINERIASGENISTKDIDEMKNNSFKKGFEEYIGQVDSEDNVFIECINKNSNNVSNKDIKYKYVIYDESKTNNKKFQNINIETKNGLDKPKLECESINFKDDKYTILLTSEFETESSTGVNKRKIEVTYTITIPDYEGVTSSESNIETDTPKEVDEKVIMIDGNMTINGSNIQQFSIDGDVFVKGNNTSDLKENIVYNKYKGGIEITGSDANVTFNGNVVTSETFNVNSSNSQVSVNEKNLYAGNIYIGNKDGTHSGKSNITLANVITDNDFVVKSNGSTINIQNFYGINDKNMSSYNSSNEEKTSSSIIVNNDKDINSSLKISNEAYIMGTAYINVKNSEGNYYQTGESVAIKGNYIAYTKPLNDFEDYEFNTYGLLQMVDKKNNTNMDAIAKSKYFVDFIEEGNSNEISNGGVTLNGEKTYATGAIVYKNFSNDLVVEKSKFTNNTNEKVIEKRKEYATQVCLMGESNNKNEIEVYNNQLSNQKTVANNIVDFSKIKENISQINNSNELLVLNKDKNKTIVISKEDINVSPKEELVKVNSNEIDGLIISNGNIRLVGDFEFNGAIIGGGDLEISNRQQKNINYDKEVINKIININYKHLNGVFRKITTTTNESSNGIDNIVNYNYRYDAKEYIKSKDWKIRKNSGN